MPILEQVFGAAVKCEQPIFRMFVRFVPAIAQDVFDLDLVLLNQMSGNEEEPMAMQRVMLAAHHGWAAAFSDFEEFVDAGREGRGASHFLVVSGTARRMTA